MITIIYVCDQEPGKSCHIRLPKLIREVFFVFPGCFCMLHIFFRHFRHCQNKAALRWTCGSCSVVEQERIVGDSAGG